MKQTKSPYCKASNCTDLADVMCGMDEVNYLIRMAVKNGTATKMLQMQLARLAAKKVKFESKIN